MRNSSLVLGSILLFCSMAFSNPQEESDYEYGKAPVFKNYFGASAGFITGYGISYRRQLSELWGLQINFAPYFKTTKDPYDYNYWNNPNFSTSYYSYTSTVDSGSFHFGSVSLGVTALRTVAQGRFFRALLYSGINTLSKYENSTFYYTKRLNDYSYQTSTFHETIYTLTSKITLGGGGGFELYAWRFAFNLMAGLRAGVNFPDRSPEFFPSIEGGIHFMY